MKRNLEVLKKGSALSRHVMFSVFISLKVVSQRKRKKIGDSVAWSPSKARTSRDTLEICRVRKLQITNSRIPVTGYYHRVVTSSSWSIYSTATRSWIICYSLQSSNTEFLRWKRYPARLIAISLRFHCFFKYFWNLCFQHGLSCCGFIKPSVSSLLRTPLEKQTFTAFLHRY